MLKIVAFGRIGILGVGLGVGAALASMPGVASADPAPDPNLVSSIDVSPLVQGGLSAISVDPTSNIAISIDGFTLLQEGTASATSGSGDFAIAFGDGSSATATGGVGDYASAYGTDATAFAGDGNFDYASANSVLSTTGGTATASGGNFDVAQEGGLNGVATAGNGSFDSAYALTGASGTAIAEFGNGDSATNIADGTSIAGGTSDSLLGNYDIAENLGSLSQRHRRVERYRGRQLRRCRHLGSRHWRCDRDRNEFPGLYFTWLVLTSPPSCDAPQQEPRHLVLTRSTRRSRDVR